MSKSQGKAGTDRADPSRWPTVALLMLTDRQRELCRARVSGSCAALYLPISQAGTIPSEFNKHGAGHGQAGVSHLKGSRLA